MAEDKSVTLGEVKKDIAAFRNSTGYSKLRLRMEDDFSLYRLKPYDAGSGYTSYTSNTPRVFVDKFVALLAGADIIIRYPLDTLTEEERRVANNNERFWYGVLNVNDAKNAMLSIPSVLEQMAWYGAVRGGFFENAYVHKDENGKTIPRLNIWDRYNVSYAQDDIGIVWAAHTRNISAQQAKFQYGIEVSTLDKEVEVIDYWNRAYHIIFVGNRAEPVEKVKHKLGYCPVGFIKVGSMPPIWQDNYNYTNIHEGESIFAPVRELIPIFNKTMSDHLSIVRRGVKVPLGYWSAMGDKNIEEDIWQTEKAASVPMATGEEIKPLWTPTMPPDSMNLISIISGELQRAMFPNTTYGELGFRLSGFAINQLQASIETIMLFNIQATQRGLSMGLKWIAEQFATGNFPSFGIRGRTSRNEAFGMPKEYIITPEDIRADWMPEVRVEPSLPKDKAQDIIMANMAREGATPLLSYETIRDDILGVKDTDLESAKISHEWAKTLPIPRLYEAYLAALDDGRPDVAENILGQLRQMLGQLGMQPGGKGGAGQGGAPPSLQQFAAGNRGVGAPPAGVGAPSNVAPSESLGGVPPGAQNAQMGFEGM